MLSMFNFIFFKTYIKANKEEFRKKTLSRSNSKLLTLTLELKDLYVNKNGIEWEDDNKEIVAGNTHFDIVTIKLNKKSAEIILIEDRDENSLFAKHLSTSKERSKQLADISGFLLNLIYLQNQQNINLINNSNKADLNSKYPCFTEQYCILKIVKPPMA